MEPEARRDIAVEDASLQPNPPRRSFVHRWSVRAGFAIGIGSSATALVVLVLGLLFDNTVADRAAFWFAVAAIAFGLSALATR